MVRLRPVVPEQLPVLVPNSPNFQLEHDVTGRGFVCSAAVTNQLEPEPVTETVAGRRPLRKLFSSEQRSLYMAHAPFSLWFRNDVAAKSTAFLNRHGFDVGAEQHSKTTRALEFFANEFKRSDIHGTLS